MTLKILDCRLMIVGREWLKTFAPRLEGLRPFQPYKFGCSYPQGFLNRQSAIDNQQYGRSERNMHATTKREA